MAGHLQALTLRSKGQRSNSNHNPNLGLWLALKGKRLKLAAPKSVDIQYMVGPRHALTLRSKGQILTRSLTTGWARIRSLLQCSILNHQSVLVRGTYTYSVK